MRRLTFDELMATRVKALIEKHGKSVRAVSIALGRKPHDLQRRLAVGYADRRPLGTDDVDAILAELGASALDLCEPILIGSDLRILTWIVESESESRARATDLFEGAKDNLARLIGQGLATEDEKNELRPTPAGVALVQKAAIGAVTMPTTTTTERTP